MSEENAEGASRQTLQQRIVAKGPPNVITIPRRGSNANSLDNTGVGKQNEVDSCKPEILTGEEESSSLTNAVLAGSEGIQSEASRGPSFWNGPRVGTFLENARRSAWVTASSWIDSALDYSVVQNVLAGAYVLGSGVVAGLGPHFDFMLGSTLAVALTHSVPSHLSLPTIAATSTAVLFKRYLDSELWSETDETDDGATECAK